MPPRLEIKDLHSPDILEPTHRHSPETYEDVYYLVEFTVGWKGEVGGDLFSIVVATPEALRRQAGEAVVLSDRAVLVVRDFEWKHIRAHLDALVDACSREHWTDAVLALQRYFRWEYEDLK